MYAGVSSGGGGQSVAIGLGRGRGALAHYEYLAQVEYEIKQGVPPAIAWSHWSLYIPAPGVTTLRLRLRDRTNGAVKAWVFTGPGTDWSSLVQTAYSESNNGSIDMTFSVSPGTTYFIAINCNLNKTVLTFENPTTRAATPTISVNQTTGQATITNNEPGTVLAYRINDGDWQMYYYSPVQMPPNSYIYAVSHSGAGKLESYEASGYYFVD